ncbi:universal stress protein [Rhodococcus sp. Leaf7]|jgi:nucleotide-binding universal stress UspA family protein|uniref:universal stress protein n=1 Tax=unclassified Rhodococcus (in: high G+C Gram-positive bacteria) TaxID=192944 RepID=UPI0005AC4A47|nr:MULTISPECIES: universal stress protein [unclassified Rhodococcus (in: high G+C Gram-positive bacteria)]KIQ19682.1 universal stress protein [Rhodococcus sp. MEB064]KQU06180.1 universal stress protein [Rhodococcus sp. Leaf7]KQU41696.1 universal stress protein [Rhodococcus sp. Leaf247]
MSAYRNVVVGTDGSDSSLRAVEKAAALAGDSDATLYIACAYYPADSKSSSQDADALKEDAYQITGSAPTQEILRTAKERAVAAGASSIEERPVVGNPVDSLLELVGEVKADLLVVGNRGLNSLTGRLLGSVPSDAARKARCDVLIVHTTH